MLGIYAAIAAPCVIVQALASYLYSPFLVPLAHSWNKNDTKSVKRQLTKLFLGAGTIIVICLILSALIGASALELVYGEKIHEYAWMVLPAMIAASTMAIASLFTDLFIVMRKFLLAVVINLSALIACAALFLPLTSAYCINGVNLTIAGSFALGIAVGLLGWGVPGRRKQHT